MRLAGRLAAGLTGLAWASVVHASSSDDPFDAALSAVLQTQGPQAIALYETVLASNPTPTVARLARCGRARLLGEPSMPQPVMAGEPLADDVLTAYRRYWVKAMNPAGRDEAETELFATLAEAAGSPDPADRDAVLAAMSEQLRAKGVFTAALGRTAALYDLMLYLDQRERPTSVDLPDGTQHLTTVFYMQTMVSYGWTRHFTCGVTGTGGFATEDGLYVVEDQYDLDAEEFKVSFLVHETRHFADYALFPGLEGPELEYRAKLTELAMVEETLVELLDRFEPDQSDDRGNPHSHANKRVLAALRRELGLADDADLRQADAVALREAARTLLIRDNAERTAAAAKP